MANKILVVDDEQEIRELLRDFLSGEGYELILASNGTEALELARKESPQLILLDVLMPGIDGIETCKKLKSEEKTRFIPVIVLTAVGDKCNQAIEAGADDFVCKPFEMMELSIRVKSMLRIRHLTEELDRTVAYMRELEENLHSLDSNGT